MRNCCELLDNPVTRRFLFRLNRPGHYAATYRAIPRSSEATRLAIPFHVLGEADMRTNEWL